MTKTYLSKTEVLYIPGPSSAPPGDVFHVLHRSVSGPYRHFCNDADGFKHRRRELAAPAGLWCSKCLQQYAKKNGYIDRLGDEPLDGHFIVAAGYEWLKSTVISALGGQWDTPLTTCRDMVADFRSALSGEASRYGFAVAWLADHEPLPVLVADRPDYYFNWPQLRLITLEKVNAARLAAEKQRRLDREAAKVAEKYRQGATFKLW